MASLTTTAVYLLTISIGGLIEGKDASCNQCVNFKSQLGKNTVENKALFEHTFLSTTRFNNFQNCFFECADDCRCMSYNFQTRPSSDGSQLCELNTADIATRPDSLKDRPGFTYHDIVPEFNIGQCDDQSCSMKCCQSSPCLNGGKCREICGQKKRLQCNCTAAVLGDLCAIQAKSCLDHFRFNQSATPGFYDIQDNSGEAFTVFCDFSSTENRAWTLITSYALNNYAKLFKGVAFYKPHSVNESSPNWDAYRLSKTRILSIHSQSSQWRATCNYNTDGVIFTDYIQSTFDHVDPMTYKVHSCQKVTYVNIRGSSCMDCTILIAQDDKYDFGIASYYSEHGIKPKCDFVNSPGVKDNEGSFGFFTNEEGINNINTGHRCSAGPAATTQYWFGASLQPN